MGWDREVLVAKELEHQKQWGEMRRRLRETDASRQEELDARDGRVLGRNMAALKRARHAMGGFTWDGAVALDIGARDAVARLQLLDQCSEWVGIDVLPAALGVLEMALEEAPEGWDRRFDVIYASHVMEHAMDLSLSLDTIRRLLSPRGVFCMVVPVLADDQNPAHYVNMDSFGWATRLRAHELMPLLVEVDRDVFCDLRVVVCHLDAYPKK